MRILRGLITSNHDEMKFLMYGTDGMYLQIVSEQKSGFPLDRDEWEELKRQGDLFFEDIKEEK